MKLFEGAPTHVVSAGIGAALLLSGCSATASDAGASATVTAASAPSDATPAPTSGAGGAVPATIPAGVRLPDEGESGWVAATGWQYSPCEGVDVTVNAASDVRTIELSVVESESDQTLAVFPDAQAAAEFAKLLRKEAESCGTFSSGDESTTVMVGPLEGQWDEGVVVSHSSLPAGSTAEGPAQAVSGEYLLAARTGSAVALSHGVSRWHSTSHPEPVPEAVAAYREPLDELAPQLCVFTQEGC